MGYFADQHRSGSRQNLGQSAFVVGIQMLDQDKSHAGIERQVLKQLSKRLETSSGSADANNGEEMRVSVFWGLDFDLSLMTWLFTGRNTSRQVKPRGPLTIRFK
jgi:hypothetical protein